MATDATGVPTPLGIPKFDTSVDAPSGLGSNAQMDAIDTLLQARVAKPASIVAGEVPVWNGTGWDRSSVTRIGPSSLGSGTPDATKVLLGDGTWGVAAASPTGTVVHTSAITIPSGWLLADGSAVSRTTYSALWAALSATKGTFTVTIATPGVFTLTGHGLVVGDSVYLTTTGALPTGLTANTRYFVSVVTDANTFQLSATRGGTSIATSGTQSGVHTLVLAPYGVGDGSTTFNLPDVAGRLIASRAVGGHADMAALGRDEGVAFANRRMKHRTSLTDTGHNHTTNVGTGTGGSLGNSYRFANFTGQTTDGSLVNAAVTGITVGTGVGTDPLDEPANIVLNPIIKT